MQHWTSNGSIRQGYNSWDICAADQDLAMASAQEKSPSAIMVVEMMAAPLDIDLVMASYEATALNADDQFCVSSRSTFRVAHSYGLRR